MLRFLLKARQKKLCPQMPEERLVNLTSKSTLPMRRNSLTSLSMKIISAIGLEPIMKCYEHFVLTN